MSFLTLKALKAGYTRLARARGAREKCICHFPVVQKLSSP
ncbi:hypothetical protein WN55_08428 [Dufourea novaeangliae]|uniref:Uncharacterized protein n=1 Tax=Dufourea novaeangliae TaxID=178035 RepID=A0A154P6T5_DUFNO|nr:hypothetical protein WN55_08428 [Dufourea novaeangliae]